MFIYPRVKFKFIK